MRRALLLVCVVASCVGLILLRSTVPGAIGNQALPPEPREQREPSEPARLEVAVAKNDTEAPRPDSATPRREVLTIPADRVRVADLDESQQKILKRVNGVLASAREATIGAEATIARDDWAVVERVWSETASKINSAADEILDYEKPLAREMGRKVMESAQAGLPVPYPALPNGDLPKDRGPYELNITSSYGGVTYLLTPSITPELVRVVDSKHAAERERLALLCSLVRPLFQ